MRDVPHRASRPHKYCRHQRKILHRVSRQSSNHGAASRYSQHIRDLADGHPEFAVIRENRRDPSTIKLNHALHLKPIRRGPTGPIVQLDCSDCHRPAAAKNSWSYADASYAASSPTSETVNTSASNGDALPAHNPPTGRELMAPVTFANACTSCHLLSFDKRFSEGVPHDKPEVIHAFLKKRFQDYAAAHPSELQSARDPDRDLTGKPLPLESKRQPPHSGLRFEPLTPSSFYGAKPACNATSFPSIETANCLRYIKPRRQAKTFCRTLPKLASPPAGCRTQNSTTKLMEALPALVATKKRCIALIPMTCCCQELKLAKPVMRPALTMPNRAASNVTPITAGQREKKSLLRSVFHR